VSCSIVPVKNPFPSGLKGTNTGFRRRDDDGGRGHRPLPVDAVKATQMDELLLDA
jgi:hypothetical protein